MSDPGVRGVCKSSSLRYPRMVSIHTLTPTSNGLVSTLAFRPAQRMGIRQTAAQAATIVPMLASQAATVKRRSQSVRMLTASVGAVSETTFKDGRAD